jgi:hypothetical protein
MRSIVTCFLRPILVGRWNVGGEMGEACSTQGEVRRAYKMLVGNTEGNVPLGRIGKGKVVPVLWGPRHEGVLGEWRYSSTPSLTSALDGGKWSVPLPGCFTARERASGTHWMGGWIGLRATLGAVVKGKIPSPLRESNPRTPSSP